MNHSAFITYCLWSKIWADFKEPCFIELCFVCVFSFFWVAVKWLYHKVHIVCLRINSLQAIYCTQSFISNLALWSSNFSLLTWDKSALKEEMISFREPNCNIESEKLVSNCISFVNCLLYESKLVQVFSLNNVFYFILCEFLWIFIHLSLNKIADALRFGSYPLAACFKSIWLEPSKAL